jgi:hypothetical protein
VNRIDIIIAPHHLDVSLPEADSQDILPLVALRSMLLRQQLTLLGFSSTFYVAKFIINIIAVLSPNTDII